MYMRIKALVIAICAMLMLTACNGATVEEIPSEPTSSIAESSEVSSEPTPSKEESKLVSSETPSSEVESSKPTSSKADKPQSTTPPKVIEQNSSLPTSSYDENAVSSSKVQVTITDANSLPIGNLSCKIGFAPPMTNGADTPKDYAGTTDSSGNWIFSLFQGDFDRGISSVTIQWDKNFKVTGTSINGTQVEGIAAEKDNHFFASVGTMINPLARPTPDETVLIRLVIEELPAE